MLNILFTIESWDEHLTWARVIAAVVFLPGTVMAFALMLVSGLLALAWAALDKPIRRKAKSQEFADEETEKLIRAWAKAVVEGKTSKTEKL